MRETPAQSVAVRPNLTLLHPFLPLLPHTHIHAKTAHSGGGYALTGYADASCAGTAVATWSHVNLGACTDIGNGSMYVKLSTTVQILGTYMGSACSGTSLSASSVNAVGAYGRAVCTTTGSNSIKIEMDAGGSTMTLNAYTAPACSGNAISTWAGVSGGNGMCAAATSGFGVAMSFGGLGVALPTPSATPSPVPPSPSPSPGVPPQKVALLGVYKDAACTTLYDGVPKLDAVGTVGSCSGLTGLGSGLITLASASAQTFDVKGYSTGDGSGNNCGNTALAIWKNGARREPQHPSPRPRVALTPAPSPTPLPCAHPLHSTQCR